MNFDFLMPVKIVSGESCVINHGADFALGKKCLIVTGRSSAKKSGALDDVCSVLREKDIIWTIFDEISENPLLSVCEKGGRQAAAFGADFVIGIGGGSALDAAKAIAAFALHQEISAMDLFTLGCDCSLPLILIPTTAGTGSEANPYAVMSLDGENKKKTFKSVHSYAKFAFLDPKYTASLNAEYSLSTALDAFCHCLESFVSPKSTQISELFAVYGAKTIWEVFERRYKNQEVILDMADREALLYASCAAGIAINTTGTGFPHPLGYNLTMFYGTPHGRACGAFVGEFVRYTWKNRAGAERIDEFVARTGISYDDLVERIPALAAVNMELDEETIDRFVEKVKSAGNFANNPYVIDETEMKEIYTKLFTR